MFRLSRFCLALSITLPMIAFQASAATDIIPAPAHMSVNTGTYELPIHVTISYDRMELRPAAELLREIIAPATGYRITLRHSRSGDIRLMTKEGDPESYTLVSSSDGVCIEAPDYKGIVHGIATLRQMLPHQIERKEVSHDTGWSVPCVEICDKPSYEWRGLMLDPVRHFYSVEETKRLLDLMSLYKFSKFHWHLIDSQNWRIEIRRYPLLTERGAWRDASSEGMDQACMERSEKENDSSFRLPEEHFRTIDGKRMYGGYYTHQDIREIVRYARIRGIDVVPEIDMPGHNGMTTCCYPWTSCSEGEPLCVGSDEVITFARNVFKEVFRLFPYEYAEIGGDEVNRDRWKSCPRCQERIRREGLNGVEELQAWFTRTMEAYFNANGRRLIGWDEILEGGVTPTAVINWWQGYHSDVVMKAADGGNEVICCPTDFCYFDYPQDDDTMKALYDGAIVPEGLSPDQAKLVKGIQANIWCEMIPSEARMQYMTFPRALALAEKAWSSPDNLSWESYSTRLREHLIRLSAMGVNYRPVKQ